MLNNKNLPDFNGHNLEFTEFYKRINNKVNKQFFFELEFDLDTFGKKFSPLINNISMQMPDLPLLTNWNQINKVNIAYIN